MTALQQRTNSRFIPAAELKSRYAVFGHFYSVRISRSQIVDCRSVLEIVAPDRVPANLSMISQQKPDAIFIMMNPGSSQPLVDVNNQIHAASIHQLPISLVPTKPDTTQYQVMRLMQHCQWQHVRVLNLSDLRCTQSPLFFKQFQALEAESSFDSHSVFSDRRTAELKTKLTDDKTLPVILAWGVSEKLDPLIQRCNSRLLRHKTIKGLLKDGTTDKYLHPLPTLQSQKIAWFSRMIEHFPQ